MRLPAGQSDQHGGRAKALQSSIPAADSGLDAFDGCVLDYPGLKGNALRNSSLRFSAGRHNKERGANYLWLVMVMTGISWFLIFRLGISGRPAIGSAVLRFKKPHQQAHVLVT